MNGFKKKMTAKSVGALVARIVIMLAIPYAYLMLCGLIFDKWLHMYKATGFIFWSLMTFWAIALALSVLSVIWYVKSRQEKPGTPRAAKGSSRKRSAAEAPEEK